VSKRAEALLKKLESGAPTEGALVTWLKEDIKRTGIVWSRSDKPSGFWVIPEDLKDVEDMVHLTYRMKASPESRWQELS
jgi:hypothetical protein